jgi:hypothetical protein
MRQPRRRHPHRRRRQATRSARAVVDERAGLGAPRPALRHSADRSARRNLSGALKSRVSRTCSRSPYETSETGTESKPWILAPGYARRIGGCVATMNRASPPPASRSRRSPPGVEPRRAISRRKGRGAPCARPSGWVFSSGARRRRAGMGESCSISHAPQRRAALTPPDRLTIDPRQCPPFPVATPPSRSFTSTPPAIPSASTCSPWKRRCAPTPRRTARTWSAGGWRD